MRATPAAVKTSESLNEDEVYIFSSIIMINIFQEIRVKDARRGIGRKEERKGEGRKKGSSRATHTAIFGGGN